MPIISSGPFDGGTIGGQLALTGDLTGKADGLYVGPSAIAANSVLIEADAENLATPTNLAYLFLGDLNAAQGAGIAFAVDRNGVVYGGATAAPADGSLAASKWSLWIDATPGATKLMVKAKDSGGTVRTASINLA